MDRSKCRLRLDQIEKTNQKMIIWLIIQLIIWLISIINVGVKGTWPTSFRWSGGTGQGETAINWSIESSTPIYKGTSSVRVTEHWNRLPREVVDSLLWRYSRPAWMPTCAVCCRGYVLQGGWTQWSLEVPSKPYNSVILWFCEMRCRLTFRFLQ
mgnify:CR=1 FL=1